MSNGQIQLYKNLKSIHSKDLPFKEDEKKTSKMRKLHTWNWSE